TIDVFNLQGSKTVLALIRPFLTGPLTILPRQAQPWPTIDALIRNRKHEGRTQLQPDFPSALVTMVEDELKQQSETKPQSESTSGQSERDLVASRCNHSRRRRSLDRADVRHLGRIKGFVDPRLLQCPGIILVILFLQVLVALKTGNLRSDVGQLFHPILQLDLLATQVVQF